MEPSPADFRLSAQKIRATAQRYDARARVSLLEGAEILERHAQILEGATYLNRVKRSSLLGVLKETWRELTCSHEMKLDRGRYVCTKCPIVSGDAT